MTSNSASGPDVLCSRAQLLTKQVSAANEVLAPLLTMQAALDTDGYHLSVKVLNIYSNACIGATTISGLMMDCLLPPLRSVLSQKIEAVSEQRNGWERELMSVLQQLQAMGMESQGAP